MSRELWSVHQILSRRGLTSTLHVFEKETQLFFDVEHFKDLISCLEWDEAESYLLAFSQPNQGGSDWNQTKNAWTTKVHHHD